MARAHDKLSGILKVLSLALAVFFLTTPFLSADIIINVLAVNSKDVAVEKDVEFSLPGEIKPEDVIDPAGLKIDYNVQDAGYYLHEKFLFQPKESKTFRVRIKDIWRITPEEVSGIRKEIESGFKELGAEKDEQNGEALRQKLLDKLEYILSEQEQSSGGAEQRIDTYRNHQRALQEIKADANLIDYWRSDARKDEPKRVINYVIEVSNPSDKPKKVKQQHYLPAEVRPEYIVDRQGYEIRFNEKKKEPFLFKEEDLAPNEKKTVRIGIKDVWFIPGQEMEYVRERTGTILESLQDSQYLETAKALSNGIINGLDLIQALQETEQPDIRQHIGAYRINEKRFAKAKEDLDALEKLLSRFRAELEKSRVKNILQKIQSMRSLSRVSQAIFDKKPRVNAAWKLIGSVMIFLGLLTVIHFIGWFLRSGREKKQEDITQGVREDKKAEEGF
ncbi:MAG: hypothetical protein GX606_00395 [Elusimicrobia bacterium]|nr:hypothetical protein [Elusimicrobiota bacterium]